MRLRLDQLENNQLPHHHHHLLRHLHLRFHRRLVSLPAAEINGPIMSAVLPTCVPSIRCDFVAIKPPNWMKKLIMDL